MNVTLQPVAMLVPTQECIYQPSKLRPQKTISESEFIERYADHPIEINVCPTGIVDPAEMVAKSKQVTVYSSGADCWYVRI